MLDKKEAFIFQKAPRYISSMNSDIEPKWGKMSAQHMVEHLGIIFLISANKIEPYSLSREEQDKYFRKLTSGSFQFKRNTASPAMPKELLPLRFQTFSKAKEAAIKAMKGFQEYFEQNPEAKVEHPVFGKLNYKEWLLFHDMHLKHHLKQFGIID